MKGLLVLGEFSQEGWLSELPESLTLRMENNFTRFSKLASAPAMAPNMLETSNLRLGDGQFPTGSTSLGFLNCEPRRVEFAQRLVVNI